MTRVCAAATCRCSQGLSQDTIKLAVRVLQDTVARQLTARQVCTVDLGVGQLLFCTGSTTRAEFTARLSWQQHTAAPAEPPAAPAGVPAAPSTGQPCSSSVGSNSTCSKASPAAAAKAPGSSTTAMPEKPSNCHYDRGCLGGGTRGQDSCCTERARQGCSACAAGRRSRRPRCRGAPHAARQGPGVSTGHLWAAAGGCRPISSFSQLIKESCVSHSLQVLAATMCATGPSPPTLPACWGGGSCQQVVAAAAARLQQERVARAAQDAATLSMQTARVAAQNKQAQVHMHRKRAQKQQLPVRLRAVARGLSLLVCQQ